VPVITLAGRTHVSRVGVSLLSSVGAEELIAQTSEQYVAIAVELASAPARLARLRAELRPQMAGSALMDSEAFVRDLEAAFVRMWREAPQASSAPG
jgi:predicted O-linked N-acetylglucosamine transferase (SPINDLY family)